MRFRGAIASLAIIFAVAAVGVTTVGATAPATAADPGATSATVSAAPVGAGYLLPGEDLTLQVTVTNTSKKTLAAGTADVATAATPLSSRTALGDWLDTSINDSKVSRVLGSAPFASVAAGQTQVTVITVPAASVAFPRVGIYPLKVHVTGGTTSLGTSHTVAIWGASAANPVPVAFAAPLTVPPSADGSDFIDSNTLATYTAPDGILTRELTELSSSTMAIGIDPRIIASIRVLGKSAPASALLWLDSLATIRNDTFPLAWADADLTVALQAGQPTVPAIGPLDYAIDPTRFATPTNTTSPTPAISPNSGSTPVTPALPTTASLVKWNYTLPKLSWPAENSVTSTDLSGLSASGINSLLVDSNNLAPASDDRRSAMVSFGTTSALVSDAALSTYFRDAAHAPTHADWLAATTRLTATLDLISNETTPGAPATILTLDRNWITGSDELSHTLVELAARPWVSSSTLTAISATSPTPAALVNRAQPAVRVATVRSLFAAEAGEIAFSPIAADPTAITSSRRLILLSLLSNEWGATSAAWKKAAATYLTQSAKLVHSVQVVDSSSVLLPASQSSLPITVGNELNQAATVYLTVSPRTTQLSVDKKYTRLKLSLAAEEQRRVLIPVESLSNGQVLVDVALTSSSGAPVGTTKTVPVNVQAGWETLGTLIVGALLVLVFGFGITRNILKRRKAVRE